MFILNGKSISPDSAFTAPDGTQYPANWLRLSTPEEKAAIGISEVPDQIPHDQRYFWGYDTDGNLIPNNLKMKQSHQKKENHILKRVSKHFIFHKPKKLQIHYYNQLIGM